MRARRDHKYLCRFRRRHLLTVTLALAPSVLCCICMCVVCVVCVVCGVWCVCMCVCTYVYAYGVCVCACARSSAWVVSTVATDDECRHQLTDVGAFNVVVDMLPLTPKEVEEWPRPYYPWDPPEPEKRKLTRVRLGARGLSTGRLCV